MCSHGCASHHARIAYSCPCMWWQGWTLLTPHTRPCMLPLMGAAVCGMCSGLCVACHHPRIAHSSPCSWFESRWRCALVSMIMVAVRTRGFARMPQLRVTWHVLRLRLASRVNGTAPAEGGAAESAADAAAAMTADALLPSCPPTSQLTRSRWRRVRVAGSTQVDVQSRLGA